MATAVAYWGESGVVEKKMETTIVNWGYSGITGMMILCSKFMIMITKSARPSTHGKTIAAYTPNP